VCAICQKSVSLRNHPRWLKKNRKKLHKSLTHGLTRGIEESDHRTHKGEITPNRKGISHLRKQLVSGKKLLLFVDTGDNCRCPLAIGYLSKLLQQKNIDYIDLKHMGVMTPNDLLPTPEVVQLLKEEGVDIRYHRSRPINDDLIRQADLVLGFTAIHVQTCLRRVPECKGKVFLLKDYVGLGHTGDQIHDPMGSTMEIFKKYFSEIRQSLQRLVDMEFIANPPEPKEVTIMPAVVKPKPVDDENNLPAGYYSEADLEEKVTKLKKAKVLTAPVEEVVAEAAADEKPPKSARSAKAPAAKEKKSAAAKEEAPAKAKKAAPKEKAAAPAKKAEKAAAAKAAKAEKPAKAEKAKPAAKPAKEGKASAAKAPAAKKAAEKKPAAKAAKAEPKAGKASEAKKSRK